MKTYKEKLAEWKKIKDEIKAKYATGIYSYRDLAKEYNKTDTRIMQIVRYDKYKYVKVLRKQ